MKKYLSIFAILAIFDLQAEDSNIDGDDIKDSAEMEMAQEIEQFQTLVIDDLLINSEDQTYAETSPYTKDLTKKKDSFLEKIYNFVFGKG